MWFLVEVDDVHEFVSQYDPDKSNPVKFVIHPPEPYASAHLVAVQASEGGVDISDLDPESATFTAEYIKRAMKVNPIKMVDDPYPWVLLGLSEIRPPRPKGKGKALPPIVDITEEYLKTRVRHEIVRELADKIAALSQVDMVTEGNSVPPSESRD